MDLDEKLLTVLNPATWKSGKEIREEISDKYPGTRGLRSTMYVRLNRLEEQGLVASKYRHEPQPVVRTQGGLGTREYSLTRGGVARKVRILSIEDPGIAPGMLPSEA